MTTQTNKSLFNRPEKPYVHPYFGGMILGIVLFLAILLTGNGLGSSGATTRLVTFAQDQIAPAHVDNTPYLLKLAGGDKQPLLDLVGRKRVPNRTAFVQMFASNWCLGIAKKPRSP